jgi:hypothetical protein
MGFVFHYISDATELLHFTQPPRALKFYNFVCSIEEGLEPRRIPLDDNEADREIISFYVRYHHLLFQNDTTGSNALIGAWQKKLGHRNLWENFNLGYTWNPPPKSRKERTRSLPARAATRRSTGGISAPKPARKIDPLPRRKSTEYHYSSDSTLTPLPSSDDEGDISLQIATTQSQKSPSPSSWSAAWRPTAGPSSRDPSKCSVGVIDQHISYNYTLQDEIMDPGDEPPPTPPQDISFSVNPSHRETANFTTALTDVVHGNVDDPMNGTSVSAVCLQPGREPSQPTTKYNDAESLSAAIPRSSSAPRGKRRSRTNWNAKKKPPKRKKAEHVEETADQPMAIDTPAAVDPGLAPGPLTTGPVHQDVPSEPFIPRLEPLEIPSLKISIHPSTFIPPIAQETRVPFASYTNIPLSRPAPNPDLPPDGLKGPSDAPAAPIPRPALPGNPPIWAQVRIVHNLGKMNSNGRLVAPGALRIL